MVNKLGKALLLVSILATSSLVAEEKEYTKVDRIKDMITMADGMELIQKGLLYRCDDDECIKKGAEQIKSVLVNLEKVDPKDFLDKKQQYAYKFAKKRQMMLRMYVNELLDEFRDKNMDGVAQNYGFILRECASCHMILRSKSK